MSDNPKVFVVDDDPAARDSVAAMVHSKHVPVETFSSAEEFIASNSHQSLGCVVLDLRMTGMSGLDLIEWLRANGVQSPVIMITGYGDVPSAVRAMKSGAFAFLQKPCQNAELWDAISAALAWCKDRESEIRKVDEIRRRLKELTPDEYKVLTAIVSGKPNKVVASELDIGLRTVELRRANVFKKLGADSLAMAVRYAMLAGVNIEEGTAPAQTP